ncbi:MAG: HAD-IC family P-type ATPase [Eggerthellaceae bacterium]|nr:HAD-IC family P-type ATPase [Eggerthellaceae bacterium]
MSHNFNIKGLSDAEIHERISAGKINKDTNLKTRSYKQIFRENIFTIFNLVNVTIAVFVASTCIVDLRNVKNMTFMFIIIINTIIGIVQEIRSKRTTDKLSIVSASKVTVVRDGERQEIDTNDIVLGDVVILCRGAQIPADSEVVSGVCDVNESLITGESDLVHKEAGSELKSGSFVNSGMVYAKVNHVGAENYASKITAEAKQHKKVDSEIRESVNKIIYFVSVLIFPVGIQLFFNHFFAQDISWDKSILSTASAMVGMIPEGLILLTSTILAVSVIRLSKFKVLVQQLYCIETLARVDVLCIDKTGTLTSGKMKVMDIVNLDSSDMPSSELIAALANIANDDDDPNETGQAIVDYFEKNSYDKYELTHSVPFSSEKKFSGAVFKQGAYVMGAAQFILDESTFKKIEPKLDELSADARVLLIARVGGFDNDGNITGDVESLGFVRIEEEVRPTAKSTLKYFAEQGVDVKVISGDDPRTVFGIAKKLELANAEEFVDASTLKTESDIEELIHNYQVFGRVKPEQKKAIVLALQKRGHTVAMTGDGVNDTLALKAADCSVAMSSGSLAARNVSQIVLLDNDFASMPHVVAEGRHSINNLQRSASLFLVKTLLSIALAALFIFLPWQYPFIPIQLTYISGFTIGIPSFVLALEPNCDRIRGKFIENIFIYAIPGALTSMVCILILSFFGYTQYGLDQTQVSTMCVMMLGFVGILLIIRLSIPFTPNRIILLVVIACMLLFGSNFVGCLLNMVDVHLWMYDKLFAIIAKIFTLSVFTPEMVELLLLVSALAITMFFGIYQMLRYWHKRRLEQFL